MGSGPALLALKALGQEGRAQRTGLWAQGQEMVT